MRRSSTTWSCDILGCERSVTRAGNEPQSDPPRRWCKITVGIVDAEGRGREVSVYSCDENGHLEAAIVLAINYATE